MWLHHERRAYKVFTRIRFYQGDSKTPGEYVVERAFVG